MTCSTGRSPRVVRMWICRVESCPCSPRPVLVPGTVRLTCRIVNISSLSMGRSTVVSATRQGWVRPVSSTYVRSVNRSGSMFLAEPLRQVSTSKPAASMYANNFGDQPPRSNPTSTRRVSPTAQRRSGSSRVLVGFVRGGWSPKLFAYMDAAGFDVLTWRKGLAENVDPDLFTDLTYTDETGRTHQWRVADTTVDLPVGDDQVFTMRQVSLTVPGTKTGRGEHGQDSTRQIHILTTRAD